jgi:hypothetical protein
MKLPQEFGFTKAVTVTPRSDGTHHTNWKKIESSIANERDVIYVMTNCDNNVFRVGIAYQTVKKRLNGYTKVMFGILGSQNILTLSKVSEINDGQDLWEITRGDNFIVWAKKPSRFIIEYTNEFRQEVQDTEMEEAFLTHYYKPEFDNRRSRRQREQQRRG